MQRRIRCRRLGVRGKLGGGRRVGDNEEEVGNRPRKFIDKGQLIFRDHPVPETKSTELLEIK